MESKKSQLGLEILLGGAVAGIAAQVLFGEAGWGPGASLWIIGLGIISILLKEKWTDKSVEQTSRFSRLLIIPLVVLAVCFSWRDAHFLNIATTVGLVTSLGLMIQSSQTLFVKPESGNVPGLFNTGLRSLFGVSNYLKTEVDWEEAGSYYNRATVHAIIKGAFISLPFLVVFGILLSKADQNFGALISGLFDFEFTTFTGRIIDIAFYAFLAGAFLYGTSAKLKEKKVKEDKKQRYLSILEAGTFLGLINLMFFTFVVMQLGYLFGGFSYIEASADISLKDYTRKGFFELVMVAMIVLPMLMGLQRYFKPSKNKDALHFKWLVNFQIAMLLIMLVSAAQRMWLYTHAYGITELRLYASVFMVWLAFVLFWFGWTSLRGRKLNFVRGSALAGVMMVLGLNIINPDALIVRSNLNRAIKGITYDSDSLKDLSADAVPIVIKAFPKFPAEDRHILAASLKQYWEKESSKDWRDWNHARHTARKQIKQVMPEIQEWLADSSG